jgi:hypothetical protein
MQTETNKSYAESLSDSISECKVSVFFSDTGSEVALDKAIAHLVAAVSSDVFNEKI